MNTIETEVRPEFRELAQRESDGLLIRLWWVATNDTITVTVYDEKTGEGFTLYPEPDKAMDAYNHPFAYKP